MFAAEAAIEVPARNKSSRFGKGGCLGRLFSSRLMTIITHSNERHHRM